MKLFILIAICTTCIGCASLNRGFSYFRCKDNLTPLKTDKRLLVEPGLDDKGMMISSKLDSAIALVDSFFDNPFAKPIFITLCVTQKSHARHCGDYENSRGMMNWSRIFISPLAFETKTENSVLVHELTHLHTCQKIGIFRFIGNIPAWFYEGIAVVVSNGAGAEIYSDSAAIDWINKDKCFTPTKNGNLIATSGRNDFALPFHMFYRQSSLFVLYLMESNHKAFISLLSDIENKQDFSKSFEKNFGKTPKEELKLFQIELKTKSMSKKSS